MEEKNHMNQINSLVNHIRVGEWKHVRSHLQNINLKTVDFFGKTALHWACERYAPKEIIQLFLTKYPDATLVQDRYGFLPIHYSIRCEDKEVTRLLMEVAPESISKFDNRGETPLFSCMQAKGFAGTIERMLTLYKTALVLRNDHGENAMDYFFTLWYGFVYEIVSCPCEDQILNMNQLVGHGWTCQEIFDVSCLLLSHHSTLTLHSYHLSVLESAIVNPSCPWIFCELLVRLAPNQIESLRALFLFTAKKPVYDMLYVCSKCGNQFDTGIIHRDYFSCNHCLSESSFFKYHARIHRDEELEKLQFNFVCLKMNPAICSL